MNDRQFNRSSVATAFALVALLGAVVRGVGDAGGLERHGASLHDALPSKPASGPTQQPTAEAQLSAVGRQARNTGIGKAEATMALPPVPAAAQAGVQNVELVGQIGGTSEAVFVEGSYVYIGEGPRLTIVDASDPTSPILSGKSPPLHGHVQDLAVAGNYAYLATGNGGLRIVDVSNPTSPREVGSHETSWPALGVAVAADHAYVAVEESGLLVIDVSDPNNPVEVGRTGGDYKDLAISDSYAYVAYWDGLRIIDVSDPTDPTPIGFCETPDDARDVAFAGSFAYVVTGRFGLRVIDVSEPTDPIEVGSFDTPGFARGLDVAGDHAYIADGLVLRVIDVSSYANPKEVDAAATWGWAQAVFVTAGHAYVVNNSNGLRVISVSDPSNATEVGFYETLGWWPFGVAVDGGHAYTADLAKGLVVADVSDPRFPAAISSVDMPDDPDGLTVAGDYAYVAVQQDYGLRVVNISDPMNPAEVGSWDALGSAHDVTVAGAHAYVAGADLAVVDVSSPTSPRQVGLYEMQGSPADVAIQGDYAYVAAWRSGVRVVDVSDPTNPTEVGAHDTPGCSLGVAISGRTAYVADGYGGLRTLDVSDPTSPVELGSYETPEDYRSRAQSVAVAADYAYVAYEPLGLRVLDISDPANPTEVGLYRTSGYAEDVALLEQHAYIADQRGGLFILRYTGSPDTTPPASIADLGASTGDAPGTVDLDWTAPGDDGNTGTGTAYAVRYAASRIDSEAKWLAATGVSGEPSPQPAGSPESMTVSDLTPGQTYYFAIKTGDEAGNWSDLSNSPSAEPGAEPSWTLMYYLAADNDLEKYLAYKFWSLRVAAANPHVNVVALSDAEGTYTRYHVFKPDGVTSEVKGELSTGNPHTLKDFIQWAQDEYPAEHYALIFDDHGHGHTGVAYDDDAPGDDKDCNGKACLTLSEWQEALGEAEAVKVVYMTACLMGTIESGYQLRGLADYYVASEAPLWGPLPDWYVGGHTGSIGETTITVPALDSQTTPRQLAIAMAQTYYLAAANTHPGTISVANLANIEDLEQKTSALAGLLRGQMKQVHGMITQVKLDVQRFDGEDQDVAIGIDDEMVDLYHFAELVEAKSEDPVIRIAAADLMAAIEDYVLPEDQYVPGWNGRFEDDEGNSHYWDHSNSHGVSIFFTDYSRSFYKEDWLDFAAGTEWDIEPSTRGAESRGDGTATTTEWGPMLVEYVRETNPDTPDNPNPPGLVSPLSRLTSIYLPAVLRSTP